MQKTSHKKSTVSEKIAKTDLKADTFDFDYSPSPESKSVVKMKDKHQLFINGSWQNPTSDKWFPSIEPGTGEVLSQVADASEQDVNLAVESATTAFKKSWSQTTGVERARYLFRIARLLQERAKEFAVLESMDNGKPIKESRDFDIPQAAAHFFYYAGWADKLNYAVPGKSCKPLGVAAQVIPWNFPLLMAAWKIAPALAAGNTVVLKPAETSSLSALRLAEVIQEAGVPDGVVNIITGAGGVGSSLVKHKDVQKVAFTGSTEVGKLIAKNLAHSSKKLTLELGGKSAQIVFEDAALDQAVEGVVRGIYFNQGHVCSAGSRLLLEESIADLFIEKLKTRMQSLRVGNPLDKNTDIGAIHSHVELEKITALVDQAKDLGEEFYSASATDLPSKGFYFSPCFFSGVASSSSIYRQEIFGPVLAISTFRSPQEAVTKANDSHYGLAAGVWSDKSEKIQKVAAGLKAGVVWANSYNRFDPTSPFGGFKESGWGREGGLHGLLPYLEVM